MEKIKKKYISILKSYCKSNIKGISSAFLGLNDNDEIYTEIVKLYEKESSKEFNKSKIYKEEVINYNKKKKRMNFYIKGITEEDLVINKTKNENVKEEKEEVSDNDLPLKENYSNISINNTSNANVNDINNDSSINDSDQIKEIKQFIGNTIEEIISQEKNLYLKKRKKSTINNESANSILNNNNNKKQTSQSNPTFNQIIAEFLYLHSSIFNNNLYIIIVTLLKELRNCYDLISWSFFTKEIINWNNNKMLFTKATANVENINTNNNIEKNNANTRRDFKISSFNSDSYTNYLKNYNMDIISINNLSKAMNNNDIFKLSMSKINNGYIFFPLILNFFICEFIPLKIESFDYVMSIILLNYFSDWCYIKKYVYSKVSLG